MLYHWSFLGPTTAGHSSCFYNVFPVNCFFQIWRALLPHGLQIFAEMPFPCWRTWPLCVRLGSHSKLAEFASFWGLVLIIVNVECGPRVGQSADFGIAHCSLSSMSPMLLSCTECHLASLVVYLLSPLFLRWQKLPMAVIPLFGLIVTSSETRLICLTFSLYLL